MSDDKDPQLTAEDVTRILRSNESRTKITGIYCDSSPVEYYDSNQLAANKPMEDVRAEAYCDEGEHLLLGIFDGHGGAKCAQTVASRLFYYIEACLAPERRKAYWPDALEFLNDDPPQQYLGENFSFFIDDLRQKDGPMSIEDILKYSFTRLDDDISKELLAQMGKPYSPDADTSGSVAVVALVRNLDLYVAGAGDCEAVLGIFTEADAWSAKKMNDNHNGCNEKEWQRIMSEHPSEKFGDLFADYRLLGGIQPYRAFGDYFYKWDRETVLRDYKYYCSIIFESYKTPPYLTALPDVFHHQLTADDKFLILASDGLWERLTPFEAVWLVGEHMRRKKGLEPVGREKLKNYYRYERLEKMLDSFDKRTLDENAATHLLRCAIGFNHGEKYDEHKIANSLSRERGSARMHRDDISITVVFMKTDFPAKSSS